MAPSIRWLRSFLSLRSLRSLGSVLFVAALVAGWSGCGSVTSTKQDAGGSVGGSTGSGGATGAGGAKDGGTGTGGAAPDGATGTGGATPDGATGTGGANDGGTGTGGAGIDAGTDGPIDTVDVPPTIASTIPAAGATNVDLKPSLIIEFSEPMDATTVTLVLSPAATLLPASFNAQSTIVTFTPMAALAPGQTYTATVGGNDKTGNPLAGTKTFSFMTLTPDTTPPTVVGTMPANGATGVAITSSVSVTFSEAMDETSVSLTFAPVVVQGDVTWDAAGKVLTVTSPLTAGTAYTVAIVGKDSAGNSLATGSAFSFTTASPPDTTPPTVMSTIPANGTTGVGNQGAIAISFSEGMNQAMTAAAISIAPAVTCLGGWLWNADGTFASCSPATPFAFATAYTVTVGTGAKDLAGNALAAAFMFSFTTIAAPDTTPPTVLSTNPANGAIGVAQRPKILVTFSEPMDLASAQTAFQVTAPTGVTGTFNWSSNGTQMTFVPSAAFAFGTKVQFSINMAAKDANGNAKTKVDTISFQVIRQGTVTLESQAAIDGYIYSTPTVVTAGVSLAAGDVSNNLYYQSYLSFLMSALPGVTTATEAQVTIVSATLQITQTSISGDPFGKLGSMEFDQVVFGPTLETTDATVPALLSFPTTSTAAVKSVTVTTAVRDDWTNRTARTYLSQYRVRFDRNTNADSITDFVVFGSGDNTVAANRPQLTLTYNYP